MSSSVSYLNPSNASYNLRHLAEKDQAHAAYTSDSVQLAQEALRDQEQQSSSWRGVCITALAAGTYEIANCLLNIPKAISALRPDQSDFFFCVSWLNKVTENMSPAVLDYWGGMSGLANLCRDNTQAARVGSAVTELLSHTNTNVLYIGAGLAAALYFYSASGEAKENAKQKLFNQLFEIYTRAAKELGSRYQKAKQAQDEQEIEKCKRLAQRIQQKLPSIDTDLMHCKLTRVEREQILSGFRIVGSLDP